MLRWLGVFLLLGSGLMMGMTAAGEIRTRVRDLSDLSAAMSVMAGELRLNLPDTPALMKKLSEKTEGKAADLFRLCGEKLEGLETKGFGELWREAVNETGLELEQEEQAALLHLGTELGGCEGGHLIGLAEETGRVLSAAADRNRTLLREQGRIYGTIGISLGAFVAVLLF